MTGEETKTIGGWTCAFEPEKKRVFMEKRWTGPRKGGQQARFVLEPGINLLRRVQPDWVSTVQPGTSWKIMPSVLDRVRDELVKRIAAHEKDRPAKG